MYKKYDIVYVKEQGIKRGSVQMYARPAVVLQNDVENRFSPTTIVALMTSKIKREDLPIHVVLDNYKCSRRSMVLLEQVMTIPKADIVNKIDHLRPKDRVKVDTAVLISLGILERGN